MNSASRFARTTAQKGLLGIVVLILSSSVLTAQENTPITDKDKTVIIDRAITLLYENYGYPDRVTHIESTIKAKQSTNGYSKQKKIFDFLEVLNKDLEETGNDHHLNIFYGPTIVKRIQDNAPPDPQKLLEGDEEYRKMLAYENHGIRRIERLDGNIGYFKFNHFAELKYAKEALTGSMNLLKNSSALIIDLRENGGGSAETVRFLLSFFFDDSTFLGAFKRRRGSEIVKMYSSREPGIQKIPETVPIYVLTSTGTSSGAEAFADVLQEHKRGIIIGEDTHGERNPGLRFPINESLYMMIPTATRYDVQSSRYLPETKVVPDVPVEKDKALFKANLQACEALVATTDNKEQKQIVGWQIPLLQNEIQPQSLTEQTISFLVGNFEGGRRIVSDHQSIYYISEIGTKRQLLYIGNGIFQRVDKKELRLVMPHIDRPINEFEWHWIDGGIEKVKRVL